MKQGLTNKINDYLANIAVCYVKLHNLHWNVVGSQFKAVHEYLETQYDTFAKILDSTAETLKMHGEAPLASMKDYLAASTIEEIKSKKITVENVLQIVSADMKTLKVQAERIREEAESENCYAVVNMIEADLGHYSKTIWFLKSMQQ